METNTITRGVIGAGISVHQALGPGLLESMYETCLVEELRRRGLRFEQQKTIPIIYHGRRLPHDYRIDLIVENRVVLELKTIEKFDPVHTAQMLTYLRITGCTVGLLMNFNVVKLTDGIKRIVSGYVDEPEVGIPLK